LNAEIRREVTNMRRVVAFVAACSALLAGLAVTTPPAQAAEQPNLLVIMLDDAGMESLPYLPNVQQLVGNRGATFKRSFAVYPLCGPSRATYYTGQYTHNHGVLCNFPPNGSVTQLDDTRTVPVALHDAGYDTVHVGKYLNGYGHETGPVVPPGWTEWYTGYGEGTYEYTDFALSENGTVVRYGPEDYQTDVLADIAEREVRERADRPWMLSMMVLAPHATAGRLQPDGLYPDPVPAPRHRGTLAGITLPRTPAFNEADVSDKPRYVRNRPLIDDGQIAAMRRQHRARSESLLAVDEAVARLHQALVDTGQLERTLVVFTSDNGWLQGQHRFPQGKVHGYAPSAQVPLMIAGPGVTAGTRVQVVGNVDLPATLLDYAGAAPVLPPDGRSLRPLLGDPAAPWPSALYVASGPRPDAAWYEGVRTSQYLYLRHSWGEEEMYDLWADQYELDNLAGTPSDALTWLRAQTDARHGCIGVDQCRPF
jgi:N-acetylglucosamine-6-sulfatase